MSHVIFFFFTTTYEKLPRRVFPPPANSPPCRPVAYDITSPYQEEERFIS